MDINKMKLLNAFISFNPAVTNGEQTGQLSGKASLDGTSFALADNICTATLKTTCASRMLEAYQPTFGSTAGQKLEDKGALLVGKTNMDEFGMGTWGQGSHFGAGKNPWNEKHTAGSGAAAAVAVGAVTLALAADRLGEVRQAAAYCGVIGLKPTYGRISRSGLIDCAPSLEQLGIIAKDSTSLAAALETVSGHDPKDATSFKAEVPPYVNLLQEKLNVVKVAVPEDWKAFTDMAGLNKKIFQVKTVPLQYFKHALVTASIIAAVEAFSNMSNYDGVRFGLRGDGKHLQEMYRLTRTEGFSSFVKEFLTFGALISSGKYYKDYFLRAQKMRTIIKKELEDCLQQYDLLLIPAVPFSAPSLENGATGSNLPDPAAYYTAAANLSGLPAITCPIPGHKPADSLPNAGLQFIAKIWDEALLLKTVRFLEREQ